MKYRLLLLPLLAAACEPLPAYQPVVDQPGRNYPTDLAQCQALGQAAETKYLKEQQNQMMAGMLVGALVGAAIGGDDNVAYGAAAGLANTDVEQAYGGPRRIIDRCLAGRGYRVVSDLGAG
jgi:hypothetical protein